jgi:transglutaminase-like putative cysteine protease
MTRSVDAFGNVIHTLVVTGQHDQLRVSVIGTVDIFAPPGGVVDSGPALSPLVFTVETPLTQANAEVRELAESQLARPPSRDSLLALAEAIRARVADPQTGEDPAQDHAHLFIACCRARGLPARYVSGYVEPNGHVRASSHAWAEVWMDGEDGWVGIDVAHGKLAGDRHCRLAIGRDYLSAAPVRGLSTGGGEETLKVEVTVTGTGQ